MSKVCQGPCGCGSHGHVWNVCEAFEDNGHHLNHDLAGRLSQQLCTYTHMHTLYLSEYRCKQGNDAMPEQDLLCFRRHCASREVAGGDARIDNSVCTVSVFHCMHQKPKRNACYLWGILAWLLLPTPSSQFHVHQKGNLTAYGQVSYHMLVSIPLQGLVCVKECGLQSKSQRERYHCRSKNRGCT